MNVHGFEFEEWKPANKGHTTVATRGGKKYFLKKYGEFKLPRNDGTVSAKGMERLTNEFNKCMDRRVKINLALKELAGPGGNIILPIEWFVDDICYVEATEWVDGLISDDKIVKLPIDDIKFIMLTAAGALNSVHRKNIVHSDLKRSNLLAARHRVSASEEKIVGKIIDFDNSYFVDDMPEALGGDQSYLSPELYYAMYTEFAPEAMAMLSTKSDIFSLGIVFHNYLAGGDFPDFIDLPEHLEERKKNELAIYCAEPLLSESGKLVVSKKIKEEYLVNLLCAMMQPEPEDRPTALDVVMALRNKTVIPLKENSRVIPAAMAGGRKAAPAKATTPAKPTKPATPTKPAAPEKPAVPTTFCAAWDGDLITLNEDKLRAAGYVGATQEMQGTSKGYKLYKADGTSRFMLGSIMKMTGFATAGKAPAKPAATPTPAPAPAPADEDDGTLWPENSAYSYNTDAVTRAGYAKVVKCEKDGKHMYALVKASGEKKVLPFQTLKLMGFIK
ncbi:MAG: protein kinase [Clostridia bacterium]|nr:protein kinase [Clostridia bacterium]